MILDTQTLLPVVPDEKKAPNFKVHELGDNPGGFTGYDANGKIGVIAVPDNPVIKLHEIGGHAVYSGNRDDVYGAQTLADCLEEAYQCAEDIRMQTLCYPWSRDEIYRAPRPLVNATVKQAETDLRDTRKVLKAHHGGKAPLPISSYNRAVLIGIRSAAILNHMTGKSTKSIGIGSSVERAVLTNILRTCRIGNHRYTSILRAVDSLMLRPPPRDPKTGGPQPSTETIDEPNAPSVEIVVLPMPIESDNDDDVYTSSNGRINLSNPARIYRDGKIFDRTVAGMSGSVMIDASGSMQISTETLTRIASQIPAGVVAYYAGGLYRGRIIVFSRDGTRAEEAIDVGFGGNGIDYQALKYLTSVCPPPYVFVSDLKFNGSRDNIELGKAYFDTLTRNQQLTHYFELSDLERVIEQTGRIA